MKKIALFLITTAILLGGVDFLMPDQAFKPHAKVNENMQIEAGVEIASEIYLYADKLKLEIVKGDGVVIKGVVSPKSVLHHDEQVYLESPKLIATLEKEDGISGVKEVEFSLSYQGCSEQGLCYEPYTKNYTLNIDSSKLNTSSKPSILELLEKIEKKK